MSKFKQLLTSIFTGSTIGVLAGCYNDIDNEEQNDDLFNPIYYS